MRVGGQRDALVALPAGKTPSAHFTGGYLDLGAGLDNGWLYDP